MEPAKKIINHILCPLHEDIIRKVGIKNRSELSLLCVGCIDCADWNKGNQNQDRYFLEDFLNLIAQCNQRIPKLQRFPDSTNQILNTEAEILSNFSQHIKKQKEQVNVLFDKLSQSVYQKLENQKKLLIAKLEAQVKAFEDVFGYYKQKVFSYKEEHHDQVKGQKPAPLTLESLSRDVGKLTNATDLEKLLVTHYESIRNYEVFTHVTPDNAKKLAWEAIETMNEELMKNLTLMPTVSFGEKNNSLEGMVKKCSKQVDTVIKKIDIKDHVKPIKFQIQDLLISDSVILRNDNENKKMIANWVFETIKSNQARFKLLYRGSRDGFGSKDFHKQCDNKGRTVVIIENTIGNKFGGFASVPWTSSGNAVKSEESKSSFLFSVDKKQKLLYNSERNDNVLFHNPDYGPTFGTTAALRISDGCNKAINNECLLDGNEYQHLKEEGYISGTQTFTVKEIEVYSVELLELLALNIK